MTAAPHRHATTRPARAARLRTAVVPLMCVLIAAAALVVAGRSEPDPAGPVASGSTAVVTRAAAVCPPVASGPLGEKVRERLDAGAMALAPPGELLDLAGLGPARLTARVLGGEGSPARLPGSRSRATEVPVREPDRAIELRAVGGLAPGFTGFAAATLPRELGAGVAATVCGAPAEEWWFAGPGTTTSQSSTLVVSNLEATDAVVDVTVHGADGIEETVGTEGVVVLGHRTVTIEMSSLLVSQDDIGLSVRATTGQVSAAVVDTWRDDVEPAGSEWIPPSALPSTELVLPGVPGAATERTLLVVNPGDRTASVTASVTDSAGTFAAADLPEFQVEPGAVERVALPRDLAEGTFAVRLASDRPVTAGVRSVTEEPDVVYNPAVAPVATGTALPVRLEGVPDDGEVRMVLAPATVGGRTPGADSAAVTVTAVDRRGQPSTSRRVSLRPDRLTLLDAPADAAYVVVTPTAGEPTVAALVTTPDGAAVVPGVDLVLDVPTRPVLPSP